MWSLNLSKEYFKFSSAHFTTFSESEAERLHGHNYYVEVSIDGDKNELNHGMIVDLNIPKKMIKELCDSIDEKVLIAKDDPYTLINLTDTNIEVKFNKKFYSFPKSDCYILPAENVTIEELAKFISDKVESSFKTLPISAYSISVFETRGQSSTFKRIF